jgi:hypothetical protein
MSQIDAAWCQKTTVSAASVDRPTDVDMALITVVRTRHGYIICESPLYLVATRARHTRHAWQISGTLSNTDTIAAERERRNASGKTESL